MIIDLRPKRSVMAPPMKLPNQAAEGQNGEQAADHGHADIEALGDVEGIEGIQYPAPQAINEGAEHQHPEMLGEALVGLRDSTKHK